MCLERKGLEVAMSECRFMAATGAWKSLWRSASARGVFRVALSQNQGKRPVAIIELDSNALDRFANSSRS